MFIRNIRTYFPKKETHAILLFKYSCKRIAGGDFDYLGRAYGSQAAFSFAWFNFFISKTGSQVNSTPPTMFSVKRPIPNIWPLHLIYYLSATELSTR